MGMNLLFICPKCDPEKIFLGKQMFVHSLPAFLGLFPRDNDFFSGQGVCIKRS